MNMNSISSLTKVLGVVFLAATTTGWSAATDKDPGLPALRSRVELAHSSHDRVIALWALSSGQAARGLVREAERTLRLAADVSTEQAQRLGSALRLAEVLSAAGDVDEARRQIRSVEASQTSLTPMDRVTLHQAEGNLAVRIGDLLGAERLFNLQAAAAQEQGATSVEVRARVNAMRARLDRQDIAQLEPRLLSIYTQTISLMPGEERAFLLLDVGELIARAVSSFRSPVEERAYALDAYTRARQEATSVTTRAYAAGLLGSLYEDAGRHTEALQLTTEAIALAQSTDAEDQLYRWEWQAGRIEKELGRAVESQRTVDRALFTLAEIRNDVLQSSRQAFSSRIEPVYMDYADMHLREAAGLAEGSPAQQRVLRDVRDKLESLKQAEVQDYFDNSCAVVNVAAAGGIDIPGAAVVYPILLPDRTEVLIESHGILRRFSTAVSRGELTAAVRRFRIAIERPNTGDQYRQPAGALYRWLLADAAPWLASQKINTLVFVPTGPLRTIPLSALLDGNQFLIERYAVATTPAITLIPTLATPSSNRVLIAGLTKSVQGFAGLPGVNDEMRTIEAIYPGQALKDEGFSLASISTDLSAAGFSVAHLATHGEFNADHRQSFILTYDSRLTMDGLQVALARREDPLDLLVLSACSTAAGDDRAALGLAGVAIQAGAKSALASLWSISDEATAVLMGDFYKSRKAGGETKAQSLRDAQLTLLRSPDYKHPSYWAPYLLIGNWL
jgi:CHAT domain-containing protein